LEELFGVYEREPKRREGREGEGGSDFVSRSIRRVELRPSTPTSTKIELTLLPHTSELFVSLPHKRLQSRRLDPILIHLSVRLRLRVSSGKQSISNLPHLALDAGIGRKGTGSGVGARGLGVGVLEGGEGEEGLDGGGEVATEEEKRGRRGESASEDCTKTNEDEQTGEERGDIYRELAYFRGFEDL